MIDLDTQYKFLFSSTSLLYSRLLIFVVCLEFKVLQYRKIRFKKSYSSTYYFFQKEFESVMQRHESQRAKCCLYSTQEINYAVQIP